MTSKARDVDLLEFSIASNAL